MSVIPEPQISRSLDEKGNMTAAAAPPAPEPDGRQRLNSAMALVSAKYGKPGDADDGSLLADSGRSIMAAFAETGASMAFGADKLGVPGAAAVQQVAEDAAASWEDSLSQQLKDARQEKFLSDEEGKVFGPGAANPRKIIDLVVSNLPFMFTGVGIGAGITKGLLKVGTGKVVAGIAGAGAGEGMVAAPMNAKAAHDEVMKVPLAVISENQAFKDAFWAQSDDIPDRERLEAARAAVANTAAAWVGMITGASTSVLGAPSGVWMAKLLGGEGGKTIMSTMAKGFVMEGPLQELPQTIAEEIATGAAVNVLADSRREIVDDNFAESLISATVAGGLVGAGFGGIAGQTQPGDESIDPPTEEDQEAKGEAADEELRKILGMDREEAPEQAVDIRDSFEIAGEPQEVTDGSTPIGSMVRSTDPMGVTFTGRVVARSEKDVSPEEAEAIGLDVEFADEEGNPLEAVAVPGVVLRRDEETVFVPDGSEVQVLSDKEIELYEELQESDRQQSVVTSLIPDEYAKLEELLPQWLKKPAAKGKLVDELQSTIDDINKAIGEEQGRKVVNGLMEALEFAAQPLAVAEQESAGVAESIGAMTSPQLRKERARLVKESKTLKSEAAKGSPLGFLAGKKADDAETMGINKAAAEAEGIDTTGATNVGGRTVFTKGGMSMDAAAELMNESGRFGKDITANDVVDIINDEMAGKPNKFSGQAPALREDAKAADDRLRIVDAQIEALKKKTSEAFEEVHRTADEVFGDRGLEAEVQTGEAFDPFYAENEYFDTIAGHEGFRTLADLLALAEQQDATATAAVLKEESNTVAIIRRLWGIINGEQQTESGETGESDRDAEDADGEGQADAEESTETTGEPGTTPETPEPEVTPPPPKPEPTPEPEPEPEIKVSEELAETTLGLMPGPFEEPTAGKVDIHTQVAHAIKGTSEDEVVAALGKLVADGSAVVEETDAGPKWKMSRPKGVRNPSESAVNKAQRNVIEPLLDNPRVMNLLTGELMNEADTAQVRVAIAPFLNKVLQQQYADAWSASEFFAAWSIAKLSRMRLNKVDRHHPIAFTDQFFNSLTAQAIKHKKLQDKADQDRIRNRAISKALGGDLRRLHKELSEAGDLTDAGFKTVAEAFIRGFKHAVDGKPKSTLGTDLIEQRGFTAGRGWGQTEEGASFQKGKKGKKKEGIGPRLQRIHDELGSKSWTDGERLINDLTRMTSIAKLFDVTPEQVKENTGKEPSGGARRALDRTKKDFSTFAEVAAKKYVGWSDAPKKDMIAYAKRAEGDEEGFKEFQKEIKELAQDYTEKAREIATVYETQANLSGILAGMDQLVFKGPIPNEELNEFGTDLYSRGFISPHPKWSLRQYLKRLEGRESDPYIEKVRVKPLRWKAIEDVVVTKSDRDGRDVTAKEFVKRFGMAGVTFGNHVTSKERADHLNWMWDAYTNMADLLGTPYTSIGEGGTLHQAIGALGRGGKHSAHYSPNHPIDPNNRSAGTGRVINVTNKNGDGSVSHEWFHSLDYALDNRVRGEMGTYQRELQIMMMSLPKDDMTVEKFMESFIETYFGRLRVNENGELVRSRSTATAGGVRWDAPAAEKLKGALDLFLENREHTNNFRNHVSLYNDHMTGHLQTRYYSEAKKLDNGVVGDYWSSAVEMIARSGEAWTTDKLIENESENNYLVNPAFTGDNAVGPHSGYRGQPYPAGEERKAINRLYDQFAKDINFSASAMPTIKESAMPPIKALMSPYYDALQAFLDDFEANVELLEADAKTQAKAIKKKLKAEADAKADEVAELIEKTLEASEESDADDGTLTLEDMDDATIDKMLADAEASVFESEQETSDAEQQSVDEQLGAEGVEPDGGLSGGARPGDAVDATGTAKKKGKTSGKDSSDGRGAGGDGRRRGAGSTGADTGADELEGNDAGGTDGKSAKPGRGPKRPTGKRLSKEENLKAANEAAKKAAKAGVSGLGDALTGLGELFGGNGKVSSFPAFDEETYQKAKPYFIDSYNKFQMAGKSLAEWFRYMLDYFKETFGVNVAPMLKRFVQEARDGKINDIESRRSADPNAEPEQTATVEKKADDEFTDSVFDEYVPTFETPEIVIPDGWQTEYHPGKLVQSAAMASVSLPEITYQHNLPKEIVAKGRVSPAQVEQVLLAGESFGHKLENGNRRGFFIGDGTGVGKGREIAAIIIDQMAAGKGNKKAVWFSENFKLFDDAVRDYAGVTGLSKKEIESKALFSASGLKKVTAKSGVMFQTYTTARQKAVTKTKDENGEEVASSRFSKIDQMVEWLGEDFDGVIAFDEAHAMGNSIDGPGKEMSSVGASMLELRNRLPNARLLFVTATGATELENMAYLERLGLWGPETAFADVYEFVSELGRSGKNVMEMLAHTMKAKGVYNARQLSWDGVTHDQLVHAMTDEEKEQWNNAAELFVDMEKAMVDASIATGLKRIDREHKTGQFVNLTKSQTKAREQDFMLMMLTGFKAETTVAHLKKQLAAGNAAIIQLTQTGEAATNRATKDAELQEQLEAEGKLFTLSPRELLRDFIKRQFPIHEFRAEFRKPKSGKGKAKMIAVETETVNVSAKAMRDGLLAQIDKMVTPENAIDKVMKLLAEDGIGVSEVTGRVKSLAAREQNIKDFQNDENQVLIFSSAGATGASYHAALDAKNQRKRQHYILQAGWRADKVLQGMGRSHRSDQRVGAEPKYWLTTTDFGPERRFTSTIMRRLEQIGSLTSGERRAAGQGLFSAEHNIDGSYTKAAIRKTLEDMQWRSADLRAKGFPSLSTFADTTGLDVSGSNGVKEGGIPELEKFLNRLLIGKIDIGTAVFDQFFFNITTMINNAIEDETFNEGIETVIADGIDLVTKEEIRNEDGLRTNWVKVRIETKTDILKWSDHIAEMKEQENFGQIKVVQRRNSPQVFTMRPLPIADTDVVAKYELVGPYPQRQGKKLTNAKRLVISERNVFQYNELSQGGNPDFEAISKVWQEEEQTWPGGKFQEQNYVVGDILGIWDRLSFIDDVKVHRLRTDGGDMIVGRYIPPTKVERARENLQAELSQAEMDPAVIYKMLLEGATVRLVNNDEIKLRSESDEEGAKRHLIVNPKGKSKGQSGRDRISSLYEGFGVKHGETINADMFGVGIINSPEAFAKVIGRFPIAGFDGLTDEQEGNLTTDDGNKDPDLWIEELTEDELSRTPHWVKEVFDGEKLLGFSGKKGQTFEHKDRIKKSGAKWVAKIKRWVIGESKLEQIHNDMKDVMSARTGQGGYGMSAAAVQRVVDKMKAQWPGGVEVSVAQSINEVTDLDMDVDSFAAGTTFSGFYQPKSGRIWLVADGITSERHAMGVIFHEMWHAGIRSMNLKGFDSGRFLSRTFLSYRNHPVMKEVLDIYPFDTKTKDGRIKAADEFIAFLAEDGQAAMTPRERGLFKRLFNAIRAAIAKIPLFREHIGGVTDEELFEVMKKSFKAASTYGGPTKGERAETMFSISRPKVLYGVNESGSVRAAASPNADGSYTIYNTLGADLEKSSKLRKIEVKSKLEAKRWMFRTGLTPTASTKRYGPKPNTSEIHVNYTMPDETRWDRLVATFQDRFNRLQRTQEAFRRQGAKLDIETDTYHAEERMHGLVFERIRKFEDEFVKPLDEAIVAAGKQFGVTVEDVDNFLYAKHAPEANARLQDLNPEAADNDRLSGRSNEWAAETLADFESRGITAAMEAIAKRIYDINSRRLAILEREGLASKKAVKSMRDAYEFYVPLRGKSERQAEIDGDDTGLMSSGKGLSAAGKERYRYGRHSVAQDMMVHSILMMEETLIRAEKNRVGKTFMKFIQVHKNEDLWTINERTVKHRWDGELGEIVSEFRGTNDEVMVVWVAGKPHEIHIKDPVLRKSMLSLNVAQVGSIVQGIAKVTRFLAAVNTSFNPEFAIPNLLKDVQTALINLQDTDLLEQYGLGTEDSVKKLGRAALKDLSPALRGAYFRLRDKKISDDSSPAIKEWANWFDDFRAHGGKIEFFSMNTVENKRKDLTKRLDKMQRGAIPVFDQLVWMKDWVSDMNGAIENGIRLSTYKNLVQKGVDRRIAASVARNLTVNFNRKGEIGNWMNALYMFFNAGIQGTTRLFMAGKNKRVQKIMMSLAAGSFMLAEMARWIGGEDDDGEFHYDKIPDWIKENNLVLMKPDGSGGYYKLPLPYGYNVIHVIGVSMNKIWHTAQRDGLEAMAKELPAQAVRLVTATMHAFNPLGGDGGLLQMASPTVLDPFIQIAANENFYGSPIRPTQPTYLQYERPQSELYWSSVKPVTKDIAKWLNRATGGTSFRAGWVDFSPENADHIFEFMFGGAGAFALRSANYVYAVANDEDIKTRQVPMVRRFAADKPEFVVPGRYRENVSDVLQTSEALKDARSSGDIESVKEIMADDGGIARLSSVMKSTESQLRKLRAQRRSIEESKLPEKVKKNRIDAINGRIEEAQKRFNKRYKDARKAS